MYTYTLFFLPFLSIYLGFNFQTVIPGHPLYVRKVKIYQVIQFNGIKIQVFEILVEIEFFRNLEKTKKDWSVSVKNKHVQKFILGATNIKKSISTKVSLIT